eukprot:Protomagalhaensia_wolfi_Nauph_80__3629@NODE_3665_length_740_cov_969_893010_g2886_i0_p1_GENE_NODE_3665_length_740_cov_969_893010_g2886_i0NODE_3665_length_740_cov_969_893010_g2886_i0_p1_ORF_typecomplete_len153_score12_88_NODE_3665_length_740_cov_969_893010_g2886_i0128586
MKPQDYMILGGLLLILQGGCVSIVFLGYIWLLILGILGLASIAARWGPKAPRVAVATACLFVSVYRGIRSGISIGVFRSRGVDHNWFASAAPIYAFLSIAMLAAVLTIPCYVIAWDLHGSGLCLKRGSPPKHPPRNDSFPGARRELDDADMP